MLSYQWDSDIKLCIAGHGNFQGHGNFHGPELWVTHGIFHGTWKFPAPGNFHHPWKIPRPWKFPWGMEISMGVLISPQTGGAFVKLVHHCSPFVKLLTICKAAHHL